MKAWRVVSRRTNYFQQKHWESFKLAVFSRDGQNRWVSRAKRLLDSHHHRAWGHTGGRSSPTGSGRGPGRDPKWEADAAASPFTLSILKHGKEQS